MIGRISASGLGDAIYSSVKTTPMAIPFRQAHHWSRGTTGESMAILVAVHLSTVC